MPVDDGFFSKKIFAAPFGRYQARGDVATPADEVLVGREGERAYFIDQLLRTGGRGAYLVTGHRGVGKTNFVRYCLSEYKNEVFERFLRSNVGRATFWDRIAVIALTAIFLLLALLVSELAEFIALGLGEKQGSQYNPLRWFVIAPLFFICLYPALFAREVMDLIYRARKGSRPGSLLSFLFLIGISAAIWLLGPFGAPAVSMSRLLFAICAMYLWVQWTSFRPDVKGEKWQFGRKDIKTSVFLFLLFLYVTFLPREVWNYPFTPLKEIFGNLGLACAMLGIGCILRGFYVYRLGPNPVSRKIHRSVAQSYLLPGVVLLLVGIGLVLYLGIVWAVLAIGLAAIVLPSLFWNYSKKMKQGGSYYFSPQPLLVLSFKAILALAVSLQLIHPVVSKVRELKIGQVTREIGSSEETIKREMYERSKKKLTDIWKPIDSLWPDLASPVDEVRYAVNLNRVSGLKIARTNASPGLNDKNVFHSLREEILWILCVFFSLWVLFYIEYEWVIRPFLRPRADGAIDLGKFRSDRGLAEHRLSFRELAEITFPWLLYRAWLPVIMASVNLGFERLDHRRVIQAMLVSLREKYDRLFVAWNSLVASLGRLLGLLLVLFLVNIAGDRWFHMPFWGTLDEKIRKEVVAADYKDICRLFEGRQQGVGAVNLICKLRWGDEIFHILTYNIATSQTSSLSGGKRDHLLFYLFPFQEASWPETAPETEQKKLFVKGVHVRVYHVLLFFLFLLVGKLVLRRLPVFPYRDHLKKIDEVIDQLSSTTTLTSTTGVPKPSNWLSGFLISERVRNVQQEPVDPRTVEFVFLQILEDIRASAVVLPAGKNQLVSLPTPEITFVFDELDKLGSRVDPGSDVASSGGSQQREILNAERRRSAELHRLLADMKNLLSSAPARFIFVGGRNLHDEWLADQTARQPLLTNIFNAEVYLPSLLTDDSRREEGAGMYKEVQSYIQVQARRAREIYEVSLRKRRLPSFSLSVEGYAEESFIPPAPKKESETAEPIDCESTYGFQVLEVRSGERLPVAFEVNLCRDFIFFLAYRSKGNPKRLKELLASFVRPVGRVVLDTGIRSRSFPCENVLMFEDAARFRIQLLATVYRYLTLLFEPRVLRHDDKLAMSVLFLADFLFKFHRRAFSWSNLERVDEFVHIHRAPDVREILERLVTNWTSRILHPIRNGMYDFRFLSEVSREIEYISRESQEEMAAFNFTLDESLALKSVYESAIQRLGEQGGREIQDLMAGLGELYEFDQEYETARLYYRKAISLLDAELREMIGGSDFWEDQSPAIEIVGAFPPGQENARLYMTWGIARLRLMLQIGMTFELSRNYERGEVEYRNAYTLARSLLLAMLDNEGRVLAAEEGIGFDLPLSVDERLQELKHLTILFQPAFAEAWIGEKLEGGVDTSVALVEKELSALRTILPCVRDLKLNPSQGPTDLKHSNFALIISELHNKAGDLYFMKGRQLMRLSEIIRSVKQETGQEVGLGKNDEAKPPWKGQEGYLLQAHYHYCMALHELRRYVSLRHLNSKHQLNIWTVEGGERWPTFSKGAWPAFIYRAAGEAFNDLAEAMIARVSFHGLFYRISKLQRRPESETAKVVDPVGLKREMVDRCTRWIEAFKPHVELEDLLTDLPVPDYALSAGTLNGWLGIWRADKDEQGSQRDDRLLDFDQFDQHNDETRLSMAINFIMVGAKYLERGGLLEDAARELLKVCETVSLYLWWDLATRRLYTWIMAPGEQADQEMQDLKRIIKSCLASSQAREARRSYWQSLFQTAVYCFRKADQLYWRSRGGGQESQEPLIGNIIPVLAFNLLCSLGLASTRFGFEIFDLKEIRDRWMRGASAPSAQENQSAQEFAASLRINLHETISKYSFPMITRLNGLMVLIQDGVMGPCRKRDRKRVLGWTMELMELQADLDAPMYFTPFSSGMAYGLAYWFCSHRPPSPGSEGWNQLGRLRRAAQRDLNASEEMFTLRPTYYENISKLYYLYDDFNDRQMHFNHSIQMAGSELSSLLKYSIDLPDRVPGASLVSLSPSQKQERRWARKARRQSSAD